MKTLHERFWAKVAKRGPGECWEWAATKNPAGYGLIRRGGSLPHTGAHRISYEIARGPIPDGLAVDHLCRNHGCVNPAHLEAVTCRENIRRGLRGILTTHCPHGHAYDELNTRMYRGKRHCRTCDRLRPRRENRIAA